MNASLRTALPLSAVCLPALLVAAAPAPAWAVNFYANDFSDPSTASDFATDRANPGGFTIEGGTLNLNSTAADAPGQEDPFFEFHGIQTGPVGDFDAPRGSRLSVDLFVPTAWDAANGARRAGDLWARLDLPGTDNDAFPSVGVYNFDDGIGARVSVFYSSGNGSFEDFEDLPINLDALNNLAIEFTDSGINYLFNGVVIASDNDPEFDSLLSLDRAFLQTIQADDDYTAVFDNLVVVPEPASAALLAVGGLTLLRRRTR